MSVKIFATQMKTLIEDLKSKGTAAIYCDNLINYLNQAINSPEHPPSAIDVERYKAELQNWHQSNLEMFRSVISAGQQAIKASFLLNGGAAVALLAFIAHLVEFDHTSIPKFGCALLPFAYGVLAITITAGATYLSQWLYATSNPTARKWGFGFNMACIVLGLSSYGFFVWGLFAVYKLFHNYGTI